jgi:hypothetical protein
MGHSDLQPRHPDHPHRLKHFHRSRQSTHQHRRPRPHQTRPSRLPSSRRLSAASRLRAPRYRTRPTPMVATNATCGGRVRCRARLGSGAAFGVGTTPARRLPSAPSISTRTERAGNAERNRPIRRPPTRKAARGHPAATGAGGRESYNSLPVAGHRGDLPSPGPPRMPSGNPATLRA